LRARKDVADLSENNDTLLIAATLGKNATSDLADGGAIYIGYIGDSFSSPPGKDVDLIGVDLSRGEVLDADTVLFSSNGDILGDTVLRVFNQFGNQIDFDDDSGGSLESSIHFTAPESSTYYIGVSGFGNHSYNPGLAGSGSDGVSNFGYELALTTRAFDPLEYIASYSDLIQAFGANASAGQSHFDTFGVSEGRDVSFDGLQYVASYSDLIRFVGVERDVAAEHYIRFGAAEGRAPDLFDAEQYLANYSDLQLAFGDDLEAATEHYIRYGFDEGRTDHVLFA